MTSMWLAVTLIIGLVTLAFTGPALLRRAAPALVHVPRLAVAAIAASIGLWFVALLAVGPLLAWSLSGPVWLPSQAAEVCQRCLDSANPFTETVYDSGIPVITLLALPLGGGLLLLITAGRDACRRWSSTKETAKVIRQGAVSAQLHGHSVLLVKDPQPFVFTVPARWGGIVVSDAAVSVLSDNQMKAVLEHERAHLTQRHHFVGGLLETVTRRLRWIPFIAAGADAVPQYLEIAADDAARRSSGTPALASALLALGEPTTPGIVPPGPVGVLNVAGPSRVSHLVNPESGRSGAWPVAVLAVFVMGFSLFNAVVHLPYLGAAMTGCAL